MDKLYFVMPLEVFLIEQKHGREQSFKESFSKTTIVWKYTWYYLDKKQNKKLLMKNTKSLYSPPPTNRALVAG